MTRFPKFVALSGFCLVASIPGVHAGFGDKLGKFLKQLPDKMQSNKVQEPIEDSQKFLKKSQNGDVPGFGGKLEDFLNRLPEQFHSDQVQQAINASTNSFPQSQEAGLSPELFGKLLTHIDDVAGEALEEQLYPNGTLPPMTGPLLRIQLDDPMQDASVKLVIPQIAKKLNVSEVEVASALESGDQEAMTEIVSEALTRLDQAEVQTTTTEGLFDDPVEGTSTNTAPVRGLFLDPLSVGAVMAASVVMYLLASNFSSLKSCLARLQARREARTFRDSVRASSGLANEPLFAGA